MEKRKRTNWKPTDNRFVAFLDILGFKDLVARNSHEEIYERLNKISETKKRLEEIINEDDTFTEGGDAGIYTVRFSDSIALFSKNDDIENFKMFISAVSLLFADAVRNNTPMKGAIAHGTVSINKSEQIYFGQPIIDAYLLEEEVQYLGIAIHNSIDLYINNNANKLNDEDMEKEIFKCDTPLRCGKVFHSNLHWFNALISLEKYQEDCKMQIRNVIENYRYSVSGSPRKYLDNTLSILEKVTLHENSKE